MKVLITGAAGFIGSNLVMRLLSTEPGSDVVGVDNMNDYYDVSLKEWRLKQISGAASSHPEVRWKFIKGDISDKEFIDGLFESEKFDVVVNLAAQAGVRYSITNPGAYIQSNIIGFYNILEACRHSYDYRDDVYGGVVHLVYASSSSVYGSNKKVPYSTDDKVDNPVSLYAATKKSNELLAHSYSKLYDIPCTGLRFFTVYGPAGRPDMAYFGFTNKLIKGEKISIFNYGNCRRDFTYVDDIVEGVQRVMHKAPSRSVGEDGLPVPPYAIYNIGNSNPENLLDFVSILQEELVSAGVLPSYYDFESHKELVPMQPGDVPVTFADTSALERDFGFKPHTSLREGLRRFAKWYKSFYLLVLALLLLLPPAARAQSCSSSVDSVALKLVEEGFSNVRCVQTDGRKIYTIQNDRYKLQADGIAEALRIIRENDTDSLECKVIVTDFEVPKLTVTFDPATEKWSTTTRLDDSWQAVRGVRKRNSSFGKVDIVVYPQISLMNLIITQVYQSLGQLSPAVEVSLWPGMKFSYQIKIPVWNDGYGDIEGKVHPGMITLSQRFRDPFNLNIFGKFTVGTFSGSRYGAALELKYYFPNERFSVDTQLGLLGNYYFDSFVFKYDPSMYFRWNVAGNYYWPRYKMQFTLRAQRWMVGDYGLKFEVMRHFKYCTIGFYAMKATDKAAHSNGGFRFQIALPPYRYKRYKYCPRVTTSGQMGMIYNANNERYYYKEFKTEASDNIMENNSLNPYYVQSRIDAGQ